MEVLDTFLDAMGNTPLVRLRSVTRGVKPTVLAKLEMLNPGGSVKDRIGIRMIEAAERKGLLRPGGTIVEPTSGLRSRRKRAAPEIVPPVPTLHTKWVIRPSVCSQISGPVVS